MKRLVAFSVLAFACGRLPAANSTADLSGGPARKETAAVQSVKSTSEPVRVKQEVNLYYTGSARRSAAPDYKSYAGCNEDGCRTAKSARAESYRNENEKKYNLANPFYQPAKGTAFSITDVTWNHAGFDFDMAAGYDWSPYTTGGRVDNNSVAFTENISYGISDNFAILGEVRISRDDLRIEWDIVPPPNDIDRESDSKLASFGAGFKWRLADSANWISFLFGGIEHAKNVGNIFTVNTKIGYKNDDTTIYGLAAAQFINWEHENGYGFAITNDIDQTAILVLENRTINSIYYAFGAGLFAAINSDWSADLQMTFQDLGWHSQVMAQASVAYQPWQSTAVNFYGRFALWDNADGFNSDIWGPRYADGVYDWVGQAKFRDYSEYTLGVQLLAAF